MTQAQDANFVFLHVVKRFGGCLSQENQNGGCGVHLANSIMHGHAWLNISFLGLGLGIGLGLGLFLM